MSTPLTVIGVALELCGAVLIAAESLDRARGGEPLKAFAGFVRDRVTTGHAALDQYVAGTRRPSSWMLALAFPYALAIFWFPLAYFITVPDGGPLWLFALIAELVRVGRRRRDFARSVVDHPIRRGAHRRNAEGQPRGPIPFEGALAGYGPIHVPSLGLPCDLDLSTLLPDPHPPAFCERMVPAIRRSAGNVDHLP